ncbi:hypothetical protein BRADI_3g48235v3 [Brachypodium distachyon]|uniref:Uncharacterized protein n=1 Tax=Brachypodium distachyon TaxID=15368 RepID=A0A0Q3M713_BRADI|nr:hypothetical protein BRADI_3g48235v3 [Brachypodium distachyon]
MTSTRAATSSLASMSISQLLVVTTLILICAARPVAVYATRQFPAGGAGGGGRVQISQQDATAAYATLHERAGAGAATTVMAWTAQLPAGPSPKGPGH